jgi:hypothetical protein
MGEQISRLRGLDADESGGVDRGRGLRRGAADGEQADEHECES